MTIIIDGKNSVMGRIASYAAKKALQGEEIVILNCNEINITGGKKYLNKEYNRKRNMVGSSQKGPVHSRVPEKVVKRTIRGMLPDHRKGRGREAFNKIKCFNKVPEEYKDKNMEKVSRKLNGKLMNLKSLSEKR